LTPQPTEKMFQRILAAHTTVRLQSTIL